MASSNELTIGSPCKLNDVFTRAGIPVFLYELSTFFHSYWNFGKDNPSYRFITNGKPTTLSKLIILKSISYVILSGLKLIGVSAPDKM